MTRPLPRNIGQGKSYSEATRTGHDQTSSGNTVRIFAPYPGPVPFDQDHTISSPPLSELEA